MVINMSWNYELKQERDSNDNLIPLWKVIQWNTSTPNERLESTITQAVKEVAYPDD